MRRPVIGNRRPGGPLLLLAGLLMALAVPLWLLVARPAGIHQLNPGTARGLAASTPAPAVDAPAGGGPAAAVPISPPGGSRAAGPASPPPVRLRIASLSIDAPVIAEGVSADGQLSIPADIHTIGWYRWGPAPGAVAGSAVLVGHVDSAVAGTGSFFTLKNIALGASVVVTGADGRQHRYRVISREEFRKDVVPLRQIFARTGPARLTLATCGGSFDTRTRSYLDNIVVTAVPG